LEFNLPEENQDFLLAQRGSAFFSAFWQLDQTCRSYLKYGHSFKTPDNVLEWVRTMVPDNLFDEIE